MELQNTDIVTGVLMLYNHILQNEITMKLAKYSLSEWRITCEDYIIFVKLAPDHYRLHWW